MQPQTGPRRQAVPWPGWDNRPYRRSRLPASRLQHEAPQRRQGHPKRLRVAVRGLGHGGDTPAVAEIAAPVGCRIAVEDLVVPSRHGHAHDVLFARHRREAQEHHEEVGRVGGAADVRHHAVLVVVAVDPLEPGWVVVALIQRGLAPVHLSEVADEPHEAIMRGVVEQEPWQRLGVVPFAPLAELAPLKQQLLAGVREHVPEEGTHIGGLLPGIAGHLVDERPLPVHHLVVGERQDEVLVVGVEHREREVCVLPAPVDRILGHVGQDVVHPAHVPFVGEPEAAEVDGPAHTRPGRRLFGDRDHAGVPLVHEGIEVLQERHRVEVLAAAVLVGHPFIRFTRVVEIQHRRHGIDAQPVEVKVLDPGQRAGGQEVAHLVAAVVEDERAPVTVLALSGVGVLVERGAVEAGQAVGVLGEVAGHPVEDDADASLVQRIDERPEVVRRAEPAGWREEARDLVAPRAVVRELEHRQQLDVREADPVHMGDEPRGQVLIGQELAVLTAGPRPEVHFVDREGPVETLFAQRPFRNPLVVLPGVRALGTDDRRRGGRHLAGSGARIGLQERRPTRGRRELELVPCTGGNARDEQFPDPLRQPLAHRLDASIPAVPVADHTDPARIGRPNRKARAGNAIDRGRMRSEGARQFLVASLPDQVEIEVAEQQSEAIRIVDGRHVAAVAPRHFEAIRNDGGDAVERGLEQPVGMPHRHDVARTAGDEHARA